MVNISSALMEEDAIPLSTTSPQHDHPTMIIKLTQVIR
jgi:hypothetical protein